MSENPSEHGAGGNSPPPSTPHARGIGRLRRRAAWKRRALGLGAVAALVSGALAVIANLSEIAGLIAPDDTRELVARTHEEVRATEAKVESLLMLLRNQAAATGINLDIESEVTIRNAIEAIVLSGNAQKQSALGMIDGGDVPGAAERMAAVAAEQARAADTTAEVAAETWREAGALLQGLDFNRAAAAYAEADRLQPGHAPTLEMLGQSLLKAGRLEEAEQALTACLQQTPEPVTRASALGGLGQILRLRADYAGAQARFDEALSTAVAHGLETERIQALVMMAGLAREQGRLDRAETLLQQALEGAETRNDPSLEARILSSLGTVAAAREHYPAAEEFLNEALGIYRRTDDLGGKANAIGNLGAVALLQEKTDEAESLLLESVAIGRELGWTASVVPDLINLGGLATHRGDLGAADLHLAEAEELARRHGLDELIPVIVYNRGDIARERGDLETACRQWAEAEPLMAGMGSAHAVTARRQLAEAGCPPAAPAPGDVP